MRKFFFVFLFIFVSCSAFSQSWKLVWSDEFNGDSIDRQKWVFDTGTSEEGWGNNELEYYTSRPENARVIAGNLEITARKEKYRGSKYTSARLKTKGLERWTYGKIEARIKLPFKQGLWPAFWMLGDTIDYLGFPYCGEIDIMEYVNTIPDLHGTMHWFNSQRLESWGGDTIISRKNDYHIYAIEWDSASVKWFVDGKKYWEGATDETPSHTEAFHHPFFILLNLAVGGGWPGKPHGIKKNRPDVMYVDYVRVYQKG